MTRLFHLVIALITIASAPAFAQTVDVPAGAPLTLLADHDGVNTAGYGVYLCSGVVADCATRLGTSLPAAARVNGVVTVPIPAQVRGTYTIQLGAFNADNLITKSAALTFRAVAALPNPPTNLRIVAVSQSADGKQQLELLDVAQLRNVLQLPPVPSLAEREELESTPLARLHLAAPASLQ